MSNLLRDKSRGLSPVPEIQNTSVATSHDVTSDGSVQLEPNSLFRVTAGDADLNIGFSMNTTAPNVYGITVPANNYFEGGNGRDSIYLHWEASANSTTEMRLFIW